MTIGHSLYRKDPMARPLAIHNALIPKGLKVKQCSPRPFPTPLIL